jgi:hypothetical protein
MKLLGENVNSAAKVFFKAVEAYFLLKLLEIAYQKKN